MVCFSVKMVSNKPNEDLRVVDEETFKKAQVVVRKINKKNSHKPNPSNDLVIKLSEDMELMWFWVSSTSKFRALSATSTDLNENRNEVVGGTLVKKYICKNCDYQFRFPLAKNLRKLKPWSKAMHEVRNCGQVHYERIKNLWKLTCKECGYIVFLPEEDEYVNERANKDGKEKRTSFS